MDNALFSTEFLKKLELLNVLAKRIFAGKTRGEQKSSRRGASVEFADYREYTAGDDFRYIDWRAYARLEDFFLKLFVEEEDLHIYVLLDTSRSMDFGNPKKFSYGSKVAAALAYVGLSNLNRVSIVAFSGDGLKEMPLTRGKGSIFNIFEFLSSLQPNGAAHFMDDVKKFVARTKRRGLALLISDFFFEEGYEEPLKFLQYNRFDIALMQILSPEEINPVFEKDMRFVDSESNDYREVSINEHTLDLYRRRLTGYCATLSEFARKRNIGYVMSSTATDFDELVLKYFRKALIIG